MDSVRTKIQWKHALLPAIVMAVLAAYPQLSLLIVKGSPWHGAYVVSNYDETAYSAYINALVNGKPRLNDPFVAADDTGRESLYSIQFLPAYLIAIPARVLGISTSTAFIILGLCLAVLSAVALFSFIHLATGDPMLSGVGALLIMCFGTAVAFQGELSHFVRGYVLIDFFPFLRRYQPGFAFPLFFVFCGLVWRSFTDVVRRRSILFAVASGICFGLLVFSYFYLWTTAAAWLGCMVIVSFICLREYRRQIVTSTGVIGAFVCASLIPYWMMLGNRSSDLDAVGLLTNTHLPDLAHPTLILGMLTATVVGIFVYRGRFTIEQPPLILAVSLSITPVILFNQQILTGRSLQPVHYEIFIANYMVLAAMVLLIGALIGLSENHARNRKILTYFAAAAVIWGLIETSGSARNNSVAADIRDESIPALRLIGKRESLKQSADKPPVVLATNFITSDIVPTITTMRPLWNAHTSSAGGVNVQENTRLFFLFLYYSGFSDKDITAALESNSFEVTAAVFGSERAMSTVGSREPIMPEEIRQESQKYAEFVRSFDINQVRNPTLNYLIVPAKAEPNYSNLDRWYQRDAGETVGLFKIYGLTLKPLDHLGTEFTPKP